MKIKIFSFLAVVLIIGCGSNKEGTSVESILQQGAASFEAGSYSDALISFIQARDSDPDRVEAYTGTGWCYLRLDNLDAAQTEFESGAALSNTSADIFAGLAFVLAAKKQYSESNSRANSALALDAEWQFIYDAELSASDVHVLQAENYFLLGQFTQSLTVIQLLNPSFSQNVATIEGQAALAAEIERLKGLSKRIVN